MKIAEENLRAEDACVGSRKNLWMHHLATSLRPALRDLKITRESERSYKYEGEYVVGESNSATGNR